MLVSCVCSQSFLFALLLLLWRARWEITRSEHRIFACPCGLSSKTGNSRADVSATTATATSAATSSTVTALATMELATQNGAAQPQPEGQKSSPSSASTAASSTTTEISKSTTSSTKRIRSSPPYNPPAFYERGSFATDRYARPGNAVWVLKSRLGLAGPVDVTKWDWTVYAGANVH